MKISSALVVACALLASGQAFAQNAVHQNVSVSPPAQSMSGQTDSAYKLGPGDEIRMTVVNEPDLTVSQKLGAHGEIAVPLIGDFSADGLSPAELAQSLEARFRDGYLRNPQVSISIVTYRPFYIVGEVNNPGAFPFTPDLTLSTAIATAGGFSRRASRGEVYVRRRGELEEHAYPLSASLALGPGDTVRVGQSLLAGISDLPLGLIPH